MTLENDFSYPKVVEDIYKLKSFEPSEGLRLAERINFDITEEVESLNDERINFLDETRDFTLL